MVKIEKVVDGAIATVTRGDQEVRLFQGQLINYLDLETLKVVGGKLIYSIDETEVVEVIGVPAVAGGPAPEEVVKIVAETAAVTDEVATVSETPTETVTVEVVPAAAPVKTTTKKK